MASDALISALMKDVAEGLEVFRVRDGVELTDAQIEERCRNMVANLVGNYFIVPIDGEQLPVHSYACRCGRCPGLRVGGDAPTLSDEERAEWERKAEAWRALMRRAG